MDGPKEHAPRGGEDPDHEQAADGLTDEDAGDHRRQRKDADGDRDAPVAHLGGADRRVLLPRDALGVPRLAALLTLPALAVTQVAPLPAVAGERDRRSAPDRPGH